MRSNMRWKAWAASKRLCHHTSWVSRTEIRGGTKPYGRERGIYDSDLPHVLPSMPFPSVNVLLDETTKVIKTSKGRAGS
jgi:hypothetical protein